MPEEPKQYSCLIEGCAEPNKGIEEAMEIAKQCTDSILWLAREADARFGCHYIINPPQSEIPKIYQRSKILLKTSKSEGFSLPILEAWSQNCAVVCYDMGGNMDFCIDGYNCRIVTKETAPAVIKELLADEYQRSQLCRAGAETAKQFTWKKSTDLLLKYLGG